jgi:hypothetical protein
LVAGPLIALGVFAAPIFVMFWVWLIVPLIQLYDGRRHDPLASEVKAAGGQSPFDGPESG